MCPGACATGDGLATAGDPERDLQHNLMPDATAEALRAFADRLVQLELEIAELRDQQPGTNGHAAPPPDEWMPDKYLGPFGI